MVVLEIMEVKAEASLGTWVSWTSSSRVPSRLSAIVEQGSRVFTDSVGDWPYAGVVMNWPNAGGQCMMNRGENWPNSPVQVDNVWTGVRTDKTGMMNKGEKLPNSPVQVDSARWTGVRTDPTAQCRWKCIMNWGENWPNRCENWPNRCNE